MRGIRSKTIAAMLALSMLSGCAAHDAAAWQQPALIKPSPMKQRLDALPPPGQRLAVAVYSFTDQTGQFRHSDTVQTLSRAVTQGATSILVKTLQDTGHRNWFQVIEREHLDNVLRERSVIREMRSTYLGEKTVNPEALPPLLFAGVLLEGGIIGYDANTKSGGLGARFLGIGGNMQYREDTVTVYLRAVSVKTGEVLASVNARKSISSVALDANTFRYVDFKDLLEAETGVAYNEPDELALTQAIEKAVYALIMEGTVDRYWCLDAPPDQSGALLRDYIAERDALGAPKHAKLPVASDGAIYTGACAAQHSASLTPPPLANLPRIFVAPAVTGEPPSVRPIAPLQPTGPATGAVGAPIVTPTEPKRLEGG